ncbi:phytoene/squalene synthase family protein [Isoptericola jiangsuensis]|uniref:phytoene/squalene synthase family protein n=1 Tax=Isoptericola jiangsuensis TaxID=548579 RepID=UPI003AAB3904
MTRLEGQDHTSAAASRTTSHDALYDQVATRSASVVIDAYSTSFGWACRLLGPDVRDHVRAVYAMARIADEIVDDIDADLDEPQRKSLLAELDQEVADALVRGYSSNLVVHAFARTARRFGIGPELVDPFFDSMRTDLSVTEHDAESFATYVHGSAEVVGLMCLRIFVDGDDAAYDRLAPGASRLGAAFQKVNFLRDLADDLDGRGRAYFPGTGGLSGAPGDGGQGDGGQGELDDATRDALCDDIDADLAAAAVAITRLPRSSRLAVRIAHDLFAELNRRLRATPAAELRSRRVRVPDPVKVRLALRAVARERLRRRS